VRTEYIYIYARLYVRFKSNKIYFYSLQAGTFAETKKLILLK
jgi:hypothetical protein